MSTLTTARGILSAYGSRRVVSRTRRSITTILHPFRFALPLFGDATFLTNGSTALASRSRPRLRRRPFVCSTFSSYSSSSSLANPTSNPDPTPTPTPTKNLSPIGYHTFPLPIPYEVGLRLQEKILDLRLDDKASIGRGEDGRGNGRAPEEVKEKGNEKEKEEVRIARQDVILLLEHLPTYTTGRRDLPPTSTSLATTRTDPPDSPTLHPEERKVIDRGASFHFVKRGGQVTYHGPGQLVGYPVMDLNHGGGMEISTRCYVDHIQSILSEYLVEGQKLENVLAPHPDGHVGVFAGRDTKLASIGIHLRHRLTSHGFSLNVTPEPLAWFDLVLACGLADVRATSISSVLASQGRGMDAEYLRVAKVARGMMPFFERKFAREVSELKELARRGGEGCGAEVILRLCEEAEKEAERVIARDGPWRTSPDKREDADE